MTRWTSLACMLISAMPVCHAQAAALPTVTARDSQALFEAMAEVEAGDSRTIRLDGGHYEIPSADAGGCGGVNDQPASLPPVEGSITIIGRGSTLSGSDGATLPFCVQPQGKLTLRGLTLKEFGVNPLDSRIDSALVAFTFGLLRLEGVAIRDNGSLESESAPPVSSRILFSSRFGAHPPGRVEIRDSVLTGNAAVSGRGSNSGGIVVTHGELLVQDSSLTLNRVTPNGDYPHGRPAVLGANGPSELRNVTVSDNSHGIRLAGVSLLEQATITDNGYGLQNRYRLAVVRNSIIAGNDDVDCDLNPSSDSIQTAPIDFEGTNLDGDGSCGLDPGRDLVSMDPGLAPLQPIGGRLPGRQPAPGSPVLDRGDPAFCPGRDAVGRLRNTAADSDPRCALGALERPNEPPDYEIDARLTGTWYDPEHDGHYVSFQVLPIDLVAAAWWTYDADGNQVWLIGSGRVEGDTATVDVYASRGMTLPALDAARREETLWGTLELEFRNCNEMELSWETDRPGFSDGSATLTRLTTIEGLEC